MTGTSSKTTNERPVACATSRLVEAAGSVTAAAVLPERPLSLV